MREYTYVPHGRGIVCVTIAGHGSNQCPTLRTEWGLDVEELRVLDPARLVRVRVDLEPEAEAGREDEAEGECIARRRGGGGVYYIQ